MEVSPWTKISPAQVSVNVGNMDLGGHLPATRFVSDYLLGVPDLKLTEVLEIDFCWVM